MVLMDTVLREWVGGTLWVGSSANRLEMRRDGFRWGSGERKTGF